ncbi:MAG: hypothetical protein ACP5NV_02145 [Candidatus Woesearchaeota archaeon]
MIGRPEWFKYRIFGWGIAPKTWQGWIYVAVAAFLIAMSLSMTINTALHPWIFGIILGVFILDVLHIMTQLSKISDERENYHQLIIERNCSFAAIVALLGVALWQTYQNKGTILATNTAIPFDISIAVILGVMLLTKIVSTIYVKAKM